MTPADREPFRKDMGLLCRTLGVPGPGNHRSVFRQESKPSLSIYANDDGIASWKDHGSGECGDIFAAVMALDRCTFSEAVERITGDKPQAPSLRGERPQVQAKPIPEPVAPVPDPERIQRFSEHLSRHYVATKPMQLEALARRGIAPATAATWGLTYFRSLNFQGAREFKETWAIPIPDADGNYLAVKLHREQHKPKGMWAPFGTLPEKDPKHGWTTLFPPPEWFPPLEPLYICEGELKALAVISTSRHATSPTTGAGFRWTPGNIEKFAGRHVHILFDDDDEGRKFRDNTLTALSPVVASIRAFTLTMEQEQAAQ